MAVCRARMFSEKAPDFTPTNKVGGFLFPHWKANSRAEMEGHPYTRARVSPLKRRLHVRTRPRRERVCVHVREGGAGVYIVRRCDQVSHEAMTQLANPRKTGDHYARYPSPAAAGESSAHKSSVTPIAAIYFYRIRERERERPH